MCLTVTVETAIYVTQLTFIYIWGRTHVDVTKMKNLVPNLLASKYMELTSS